MPPARRKSTAKKDMSTTLVIGVVGVGDLAEEEIQAAFEDLFQTPKIDSVEVVFALTDDTIGDGAYAAYQWVVEQSAKANPGELQVAAVTSEVEEGDNVPMHEEAVDNKVRLIKGGDEQASVIVADELVKAKAAGAETRMVAFWVQEEEGAADDVDSGGQYAAIEAAIQGGVKAFNACNGFDDLVLDFDGVPEETTPEPPAEEPKRRGRGRPPKAETEAAAPVAEEEKPPARRRGRPSNADKAAAAEAAGTADEAQTQIGVDLSDDGVGVILRSFAGLIARQVVAMLKEGEEPADMAPARRGRRS